MEVDLEDVQRLRFADGSPVRAASAVSPLGDRLLIAQDDGNHAAWLHGGFATRLRLLPPVDGLDVFEEAAGTKHLKPDLEAACQVEVDGARAVLLLGSGSSPARMRSVLVRLDSGEPQVEVADLTPLYALVAEALGVAADVLNMEGACLVGEAFRWYQRGLPSAGFPSTSVDLHLPTLLQAARGVQPPDAVPITNPRPYDLGEVDGVGLAVTDAAALPDGAILVSAAAEDAPNPRDDGPVVGSALVRLKDHDVVGHAVLPLVDGEVCKVEGLTILDADDGGARVLGVVDADDPTAASLAVRLRVSW